MAFALTIVAVCLAFVYRGWRSVVANVRACQGVILMLVVSKPVVALFRPRPGVAQEVQFWLGPLGCGNVCLHFSRGQFFLEEDTGID